MSTREIGAKIDALFVEGPDDGAVVNALVKQLVGIELARRPYLVRTHDAGGGAAWAIREFATYTEQRPAARVGLIVDRHEIANDRWPAVAEILRRRGFDTRGGPASTGSIVDGRHGVWLWPDNVHHGTLEDFVAEVLPPSPALAYAAEASRIAKHDHAAEFDAADMRKATLKVRSIWRDASAAGGYGHLVRNFALRATPALDAFVKWFETLFLT